MALVHLRNAVLELLESISICHGYWRRIGAFKGVSCLRPDRMLTMGEKERPWGKFYRGPIVGAKCTYQNLELSHVRVDMAKVSSKILYVVLRVPFVKRTRGGTYKTKDFDAQVSTCVR